MGSPHHSAEDGYATAAAAMICLAISVLVSAVCAIALTELRSARASLERTQAEAKLNGAHLLAAYRIMRNGSPGRLKWTETALDTNFAVLAEPEFEKMNAAAAAAQPALLARFGASRSSETASFLVAQIGTDRPRPIAEADPAKPWRSCAPSMIGYNGRMDTPALAPAHPPDRAGNRPRAGEVWRVVIAADGWQDDRVVRLTGGGDQPEAVILRRLGRGHAMDEPCVSLMTAP